jgi:hypothetical protein
MKLAPIQAALDAVAALDGDLIRTATAERNRAEAILDMREEARHEISLPHIARLRRAMTHALRPHRIEWDYGHSGLSLDGRDYSSSIWLRGTLSPATAGPRFASSLRVTLPFDMHPKTAEQFAAQVAQLKACADAIQAAGY